MMSAMSYSIHYYSVSVQNELLGLPATLQARYIGLTDRMRVVGANLGEPHTKAMGNGLFELRLMGTEGIARVMYCTLSGRRIVMLHGFIKKTQKTPHAELATAIRRMKEVKHAEAR
jgi:phage-related protein